MKKRYKGFLIAAAILVAIGTVTVCVATIAAISSGAENPLMRGYIFAEPEYKNEQKSVFIGAETEDISITLVSEDLEIVRGGDEFVITFTEYYDGQYSWNNRGGRFEFSRINKRWPFPIVSFGWRAGMFGGVTLNIPDGAEMKNIKISEVSGNVSMLNVRAERDLTVSTTSGNIELFGCVAGSARFNTVSGEITAFGVDPGEVKANTVSGDVFLELSGDESEYRMRFNSVSGEMRVNGERAKKSQGPGDISVLVDTVSGNLEIETN